MSPKNIIPGTLVSLMLATTPVQTACADALATEKQEEVDIEKINQEFENSEGFSEHLSEFISGIEDLITDLEGEPEIKIPKLTKKYHGYWLSEEEYKQVKAYRSSKVIEGENGEKIKLKSALQDYEIVPYLGFIALMRHKPLIDFIADYYELDPMQILEVMNQETAFNIRAKGGDGERGIGQKMKDTARELVKKVTNPEHELHCPYLDKDDYRFWKLSSDYRLNIILIAAMIRNAHSDLEAVLEEKDMTREELAEKVKEIGQNDTFWYLRKISKKFNYYGMTKKRGRAINNFWEKNDVKLRDLDYLTYNGGRRAIKNLFRRRTIGEVLIANFTAYSRNKETVKRFMSLYEGADTTKNER